MPDFKRLLLALCLLLTFQMASAQKMERFYSSAYSDTASNYTLIVKPESGNVNGWLLLFPGFGETPSDVLKETDFPMKAAQAGYLVTLPYISNNTALLLSEARQKQLVQLVQDVQKKYKLQNRKLAVGGFSMGGTTAVKFTEHSLASATTPNVSALFAVDPLLDLERFERTVLKAVQREKSQGPRQMLQMLQHMLQKDFAATPVQAPEKYYTISPYAYSDTANTAIQPLKQLPVLLYSEPDVANQFNTNHRDLYDLNAADCTAMITDLQSMGNQQAQLILTSDKGRRADGSVNPHSWSILDVNTTLDWLQQHLK
ncbi:alpha/beta hydrolase [Pontibacter sp. MBLB2868]|uniref:alpha/beta hydrolase n=1 Tax=Pontibacter sp. MBLB2868 TaxID=3451555 RepID=UPI003F74E223